eukprot:scaffold50014_cov66-Cyclotella_meneghiniana.AAC.7
MASAVAQSQLVKSIRKPEDVSPSLKGYKYVIFPNSKLYIPFNLGISAGYLTLTNNWWLGFNLLLNALFVVDTFLAFFRAYRDDHGVLIYSLSRIRKNYITSGWFIANLLACIPGTIVTWSQMPSEWDDSAMDAQLQENTSLFFLFEGFKLLRLIRFNRLCETSPFIKGIWERLNVEHALMMKFLFLIVLISHWIACAWGFIAFLEAQSFGDPLRDSYNWISNWYFSNYGDEYVEGGLNPIGWENYMDRYGNIAPVTSAEWGYACFLMLLCGFFWAYIIGALVDAVSMMGKIEREYVDSMDEANQMVKDFQVKRLPNKITGSSFSEKVKVSKRVRRFITEQRDRATTKSMSYETADTLEERYPTLTIVSPELRRMCALHLTHPFIEAVPYLSSKYLSPDEQAYVALNSLNLEFGTGETFKSHKDHGRGILISRGGFFFTVRHSQRELRMRKAKTGIPPDMFEVLVEDNLHPERQLTYHFAGFTKVFFIPRSVIMEILANNEQAWKDCARWGYAGAAMILGMKSIHKSKSSMLAEGLA